MPLFLIIFLLGGAAALLRSDFLRIKTIVCKTQYGPCAGEEEERLESLEGESVVFLDSSRVKDIFVEDFKIREVYVQRVFPNKLVVFLERRKPLVAIKLRGVNEEGVFLVSKDGTVLEFTKNSSLPRLELEDNSRVVVGQKVDEEVVSALHLVYLTYKLNATPRNVEGALEKRGLVVDLGETTVYFARDKDPQVLVGALQLILSRSRIDGKLPKVIDLRYSNPVLEY